MVALKSLWIAKAASSEEIAVNSDRLAEVLRLAADTIEGLYQQLKRLPPQEGVDLIEELRAFSKEAKSN
jgi:hypothetical protein